MKGRRISFGRRQSHHPNRVLLGDSLDAMAGCRDGRVDLIYIDPPFGTGKTRRGNEAKPTHRYRDVPNHPERYVEWLSPHLAECRRVLSDRGSLFVHLDYRTVHYVKVELDRIFGRRRFINEIVWCYSVGGKSRRRFARKHDTILWYARSDGYSFHPDAVKVPRKPNSHMRVVRTTDGQLVQEKTDRKTGKVYRYPLAAGKVPEDWWADIELLNRSDAERTGWPTQKPERLLERIIKGASAEDALVADWFAGSGTTAIVAQRLGRRFAISDVSPAAVECALARLESAGRDLAAGGAPPPDILLEKADANPQMKLRL